ncbi:vesicle-trafficking protein SEC22c isoform 3-T8 [Molossus nigricans]
MRFHSDGRSLETSRLNIGLACHLSEPGGRVEECLDLDRFLTTALGSRGQHTVVHGPEAVFVNKVEHSRVQPFTGSLRRCGLSPAELRPKIFSLWPCTIILPTLLQDQRVLCGLAPSLDSVIQKVKWHFNYVSLTQIGSSLEKIQEELDVQPPAALTLEDTDVANGVMNGHTRMHLEPAPSFRMEPVTALGVLSLVLNIMCAALNLIRGIHLAEHSGQVAHEEIGNILAFLIPFIACIFQPRQDDEGGADAAVHLPGQRVPAWAEEPLADPLPHRSGLSVFTPDTDEAASGEAV